MQEGDQLTEMISPSADAVDDDVTTGTDAPSQAQEELVVATTEENSAKGKILKRGDLARIIAR
jgi:hypothetical protein